MSAKENNTTKNKNTKPTTKKKKKINDMDSTEYYTDGDKSHAARALGIGRKTLYRKLEQYGNGQS